MQHYEASITEANGSEYTRGTPSNSSTPSNGIARDDWAERLKDKYGISAPMAPDDGLDNSDLWIDL